jgi:hypothetical protein
MPSSDEYPALRRNVLGSVEDYTRLRFLGERSAELAEMRALGQEFSLEDRGAIFYNAMLNEFFGLTGDRNVYTQVLSKVNRFVDQDCTTGGRAWTLVREHLLEIGRQRGWSTSKTIYEDWTPGQQGEFTNMIENDLKEKRSGCYVATAVYGTYDCRELWVLRRFRDETLAASRVGQRLISLYYAASPIAVRYGGRPLRAILRRPLNMLVRFLVARGMSDSPYREA